MNVHQQVTEVVHKLFIYVDERDWSKIKSEVFTKDVFLDMSSLGGPAEEMSADQICEMWAEGFEGIDSVNHLSGNILVKVVDNNHAEVFAYATATHYKAEAKNGKTREFVGTYNIRLDHHFDGWRINSLTYNLKYMNGNLDLV